MKRTTTPRVPMAGTWPRMDLLGIDTDPVLATLLNRPASTLNTIKAAAFHHDVVWALASFIYDRKFQVDDVSIFLSDVRSVLVKTRKFSEVIQHISSPLQRAISEKDDDLLASEGAR